MPPDDRTPRVPQGPIGAYLIKNLEQLRKARRLSYQDLSVRLQQVGRPIPALGLSRIEKGTRRVDADDLVGLALALGVNPRALLLPSGCADRRRDRADRSEQQASVAPTPGPGRTAAGPLPAGGPLHQVDDGPAAPPWTLATNARPRVRAPLPAQTLQRDTWRNLCGSLSSPPSSRQTAACWSASGATASRPGRSSPASRAVGENPADTAVREVKEETGLRIVAGRGHRRAGAPEDGPHDDLPGRRPTHGTDVGVGDEDELADVRGSAWPRRTSGARHVRAGARAPGPRARRGVVVAPKSTKRRSPGEGSVWPYTEKNGTERWAIGHPSFGTRRRGPNGEKWFTKKAAQTALRAMLVDAARGELVDPSRQPLGDVPRRVGRRAAPRAVDDRQLPEEHPAAHRARARHGAAGGADH